MKLEVNMYVRTDLGEIGKITSVAKDNVFGDGECVFYNSEPFLKGKEIKTSYNIIDLIEVGDYVNGYKISAIYDDDSEVNEYNLKHKKCLGKNIYDEDYQEYLIYEEDIETIVTKEQFSQMEYTVD